MSLHSADESVDTAHHLCQIGHRPGATQREVVDRHLRPGVAALQQLAHVVADPGQALETALLVQ